MLSPEQKMDINFSGINIIPIAFYDNKSGFIN